MEIRIGNENDLPACLEIAKALPDFFSERGISAMELDLSKHILYIIGDGDVSGFLTVEQRSDRLAEISWMAIKKEKQGRGLGSLLINSAMEKAGANGFRIMEVKTLSDRVDFKPYEKTRRFYEKSGFVLLENNIIIPEWSPENICAIYVKAL